MDARPRRQLAEFVRRLGVSLADEPQRVKALLLDTCPEARTEIGLLVTAAEDEIPTRLARSSDSIFREGEIARAIADLRRTRRLDREAAEWSVLSWAWVLGIVPDEPDDAEQAPVSGQPADDSTPLAPAIGPHQSPSQSWPPPQPVSPQVPRPGSGQQPQPQPQLKPQPQPVVWQPPGPARQAPQPNPPQPNPPKQQGQQPHSQPPAAQPQPVQLPPGGTPPVTPTAWPSTPSPPRRRSGWRLLVLFVVLGIGLLVVIAIVGSIISALSQGSAGGGSTGLTTQGTSEAPFTPDATGTTGSGNTSVSPDTTTEGHGKSPINVMIATDFDPSGSLTSWDVTVGLWGAVRKPLRVDGGNPHAETPLTLPHGAGRYNDFTIEATYHWLDADGVPQQGTQTFPGGPIYILDGDTLTVRNDGTDTPHFALDSPSTEPSSPAPS